MKTRLFLLCMMFAGLQACTPSKNAPALPPMNYSPESRAQAAIGNSEMIDETKSSAQGNN